MIDNLKVIILSVWRHEDLAIKIMANIQKAMCSKREQAIMSKDLRDNLQRIISFNFLIMI